MTGERRPSTSPVCSADEAPADYMFARPLSRAELDALLTALRRLEDRLGDAGRRALIDHHLSDPDAAPAEAVPTAEAAAGLIARTLPLIEDAAVRADLEELARRYGM